MLNQISIGVSSGVCLKVSEKFAPSRQQMFFSWDLDDLTEDLIENDDFK